MHNTLNIPNISTPIIFLIKLQCIHLLVHLLKQRSAASLFHTNYNLSKLIKLIIVTGFIIYLFFVVMEVS